MVGADSICGEPPTPGLFSSEHGRLVKAAEGQGIIGGCALLICIMLVLEPRRMVPFAGLLAALEQIPNPRRRQGRRYPLPYLLLFSVGFTRFCGHCYAAEAADWNAAAFCSGVR